MLLAQVNIGIFNVIARYAYDPKATVVVRSKAGQNTQI
jgi:hypothetical protein